MPMIDPSVRRREDPDDDFPPLPPMPLNLRIVVWVSAGSICAVALSVAVLAVAGAAWCIKAMF